MCFRMLDHDFVLWSQSQESEWVRFIPLELSRFCPSPLWMTTNSLTARKLMDLGKGLERIKSWIKPMVALGGNLPRSEDPRPFWRSQTARATLPLFLRYSVLEEDTCEIPTKLDRTSQGAKSIIGAVATDWCTYSVRTIWMLDPCSPAIFRYPYFNLWSKASTQQRYLVPNCS